MAEPKSSPLRNVHVERRGKGLFVISWQCGLKNMGVEVFVGDSPHKINRQGSVANFKGKTSVKIEGLNPDVRQYFKLVPESGRGIITAERHQPFEGVVNFRDLGGYGTIGGQRVKWGQVFRSGHLARVTENDKALLRNMGIRAICDFRTAAEMEAQPDWIPEDGSSSYHHYPIEHGEFDPVGAMERMQKGDISWLTEDFMIKRYIQKIDQFPRLWGEIIKKITDPGYRPLVFHCTAGKDRAGACAALILLALGVPEDTVIDDHGLSNVYIADALKMINQRIKAMGIDPEKVAPYFTAPRNAIIALVDHIRNTYGSAADYLKTEAGISKKALNDLKRQLLEQHLF